MIRIFFKNEGEENTMTTPPKLNKIQLAPFKQRFGKKKIFAQCLMPIRGPQGFRKLDYDFVDQINPAEIISKIVDNGYNAFGLVVKDTDGATLSKTKIGWNPTNRDLVGEFSEICQKKNVIFFLSITNMNDAYRGALHPETVSIHIKTRKNIKKGDPGIHHEGEMRVDLPEGTTIEEMQKKIPFLTKEVDEKIGAARNARGKGYIPLTAFHCPRSKHADYMIALIKEIASNYQVDGILADYIRYSTDYFDYCGCERCRKAYTQQYPNNNPAKLKGKDWFRFRMDNILEFGKKFNDTIKSVDDNILTGWFNLPGPKFYSNRLTGQDYYGLTKVMDSALPMLYPYLTGSIDDGRYWGTLANLVHWYSQRNMKRRFKDYGKDATIFGITNSVECNTEEMLKSFIAYDYGLGIAVFKYYGTTESQWYASKLYGKILSQQEIGDNSPTRVDIRKILQKVYEKYPPKVPPKWWRENNDMQLA
ncbi:hypothetical protein WKT22_05297 [Candidatus Lokiarchaeum ossiferum]